MSWKEAACAAAGSAAATTRASNVFFMRHLFVKIDDSDKITS
jgi:hypothetical protein